MNLPSLAWFPLLAAVPPLLPLLIPRRVADRSPRRMVATARILAGISLVLGGVAAVELAAGPGPIEGQLAAWGPLGLTIYFDAVSATMFLLVAFLGTAVAAFSRNYLAGDPGQGRFLKWLSVTVGCVLCLTVAGNLAFFTLAWMGTSLSLHKLLTFYPERRGAVLAARKKYAFSRLGDLCLVGALVIAWRNFGTLDYAPLFAAARENVGGVPTLAFLLVCGAMLKSAQFPFHGWLPDTMETPTPVSALMHAGIINAGGFLVIRFSPLVALSPASLELLAGVGAFTALFASLVMITQTNVKRSLAFSTVAQMGFMMLQCGLGAFALAMLHLVAHSLYKAHAFLSSGGVIATARAAGSPPPRHYRGWGGAALAFATAVAIVLGISSLAGEPPWRDPAGFALASILAIAAAQLLWHWWAQADSPRGWLLGMLVAAVLCGGFFALHTGANHLLGSSVAPAPASTLVWPIALLAPLAFLFVALRAFLPPNWVATPIGHRLFVHAYNGFYVNTLANRILQSLRMPGFQK